MDQDVVYRTVFENSPDGVLLVEPDGTIADANPAACAMFGCAADELVGARVETLIPADAREAHGAHRRRFSEHATDPRPMGIGMELRGLRRDGTEFPVEISLSPLEGGRALATVRDVTVRTRLRDFGAGALRAAEDVRTEIARELHDQTAQEIAALMIQLRLLDRATDRDEEFAQRIAEIRDGLERTADGVRRIARGLRPPELEDAGLGAALEAHARRMHEERGLTVEVELEPVDGLLTPDSLLIVYRVVQEALHNVARHAGTDRARLRVWSEGDHVFAEVEDQGRGFRQHPAGGGAGLGLMGMYERAAMVGGRLDVHSTPGEGTRVRLTLPSEFDWEMQRV